MAPCHPQVFDTMKCLLKFVGTGEKEVVEQAGMWPDRQAWLQATKENTPQADREKKVDIKKDEEVKGRIKKEEDKSSTAENLAEIRRKKTLIEEKKKKRSEDSKSSKDIEEKRLNEEYWGRVEEERQAEEGSIIKLKQSFTKPKQSITKPQQSATKPKSNTKPQQSISKPQSSTKPQGATKPQQSALQRDDCKPPFLASALLSPVAPKSNWLVNNKWRCLDRHRRIDDLRVDLQVKVDHLPKVSVL